MTFLWPRMLALLGIVPLVVLAYVWFLRRRKKNAVRYASLSLIREALGSGPGWRRHVPPALFLLALSAMLLAVARPAAVVTLPSQYETIILAIDVSGSMRATDIAPSRLEAAQAAARNFVAKQPSNAKVGVVSFAGTASLVQPPTLDKDEVIAALERFQLQPATAVGSGILVSLKTIFPDIEIDLRSSNPRGRTHSSAADAARGTPLDQAQKPPAAEAKPVPPGSYTSAAIILLTDGQATTGPDPLEAAKMAADRGVRVYTVGIGTANGEILAAEGWSMRVRLDEESLKQIAKVTNAEYFYAGSANDLSRVYETLNSRLVLERKPTEITALVSAIAAVLALLSALLSMAWFNRVL
jgi:Ca-activated chloride channel family protein